MQSSNYEAAVAARNEYPTESLRNAFAAGYDHAHGIACHLVPQVGETHWTECSGTVTIDTVEEARDVHESLCFDAEVHSRQFAGWEQVAVEINSSEDEDEAWEAYEAGVALAIEHDLDGYTDSDYDPDNLDN